MPNFSIRSGQEDDATALLKVHRKSILTLGLAAYSQADCESWAAGLTCEGYVKAMTIGGETYFVALDDTNLVGFCSFKDDEVMGLYIAPEASRAGLGTRLLGCAEDAMKRDGQRSSRLSAALSALTFYQANGYQLLSREMWKTRGGREIQVCDMRKELCGRR